MRPFAGYAHFGGQSSFLLRDLLWQKNPRPRGQRGLQLNCLSMEDGELKIAGRTIRIICGRRRICGKKFALIRAIGVIGICGRLRICWENTVLRLLRILAAKSEFVFIGVHSWLKSFSLWLCASACRAVAFVRRPVVKFHPCPSCPIRGEKNPAVLRSLR